MNTQVSLQLQQFGVWPWGQGSHRPVVVDGCGHGCRVRFWETGTCLSFSVAVVGWSRAETDLRGQGEPGLTLFQWAGTWSPSWALRGFQIPALSGSVFAPSSRGSPRSLLGHARCTCCCIRLPPASQGSSQPLASVFLSVVPRMVPPPLPWLPELSPTTFPFSECLLSHFLPGARNSVNIFECINLALLHKGNLPVCHSSARF